MSISKTNLKTKALLKTAVFTCMSTALVATADIMEGAVPYSPLWALDINGLVDNGYNNYARQMITSSSIPGIPDGSTEFTLILAEPSTFATIFLNNGCRGDPIWRAFGES